MHVAMAAHQPRKIGIKTKKKRSSSRVYRILIKHYSLPLPLRLRNIRLLKNRVQLHNLLVAVSSTTPQQRRPVIPSSSLIRRLVLFLGHSNQYMVAGVTNFTRDARTSSAARHHASHDERVWRHVSRGAVPSVVAARPPLEI